MTIKQLCNKLFIGGEWIVAYKDINSTNNGGGYTKVDIPKGQWIADPFLYEYNGKHYLFCEQYFVKNNRAGIGVFEFVDGKPVNNKIIIDNPYHMSYPCIFTYKGQHYMIPESSANKTVDIYTATNFPFEWKHVKTLISDQKFVDTTVYKNNDDIILFTYHKQKSNYELIVLKLDMQLMVVSEIDKINYTENIGRPAGGILCNDNNILRPAQNNKNKYGESIIFYKINNISPYKEEYSHELKICNISFPEKVNRIHTINKDSQYEVIDMYKEKIDITHGIKIFKRAFLHK